MSKTIRRTKPKKAAKAQKARKIQCTASDVFGRRTRRNAKKPR